MLLGIIDDLTTGTLMVPEGAAEHAVPAQAIEWADSNTQEAIPPEAWATIGAPSVLSHRVGPRIRLLCAVLLGVPSEQALIGAS